MVLLVSSSSASGPDVQQAVAARDAAIAASIASRPAPVERPVGRPKVLAPLGVQAPPGERHVGAELQLRWSGRGGASGALASALHSKSSSSSSSRSPEAEEAGSVG